MSNRGTGRPELSDREKRIALMAYAVATISERNDIDYSFDELCEFCVKAVMSKPTASKVEGK